MTLIGLAFQNLRRKLFRTYVLALAVAIACGAVFATATIMWGIKRSLAVGFSKFGADLLVVPKDALVGVKTALLTGELSDVYMDGSLRERLLAVQGVAKVAPQVFVTRAEIVTTAEGSYGPTGNVYLIGFDPDNDFTVMPWVGQKLQRPFRGTDAIVGGKTPHQPGETLYFYGRPFTVYGRLERTGVPLYDNAVFIHIESAYELAESTRHRSDVYPLPFQRGQVSGFLIQLTQSAKPDLVRFALAKNPDIKVVAAGSVVTSARQNVNALLTGMFVLSAVMVLAIVLMISAIFSSIVNERKRELGLLRAIGAQQRAVFRLIVSESVLLTTLGGVGGVVLGAVLMRLFRRTIGFQLETFNIPFFWPELHQMGLVAAGCILLALLLGMVGAAYPAASASRLDPYAAIRQGE